MIRNNLLKVVIALSILAGLLIFLGVNFVPRIFASPSAKENAVSNLSIEQHPSNYYVNSDWNERHPSLSSDPLYFNNSDWIERHPSNYYVNSDWSERHPDLSTDPLYFDNSNWIERHPVVP